MPPRGTGAARRREASWDSVSTVLYLARSGGSTLLINLGGYRPAEFALDYW